MPERLPKMRKKEYRLLWRFVTVMFKTKLFFYYIDTSVLLENTPLIKFIRNYIRNSGGIFSIPSLVKILMISLVPSLSLKVYLNSLIGI